MIKNIIFDIGNVLVTFDPLTYFQTYFDKPTCAFLCEEIFASEQWLYVDQGLLREEEARAYFLKKLPLYQAQIHTVFDHWKGLMVEKKDTLSLFDELQKQGYAIYILSNIGEESYAYCQQHFSFLNEAKGGVYSYQEKLIKPDERIYTCLLDRYQLISRECVFLDDATENIEAANKLGIHGIVFRNADQAKAELTQLLEEEDHVKD